MSTWNCVLELDADRRVVSGSTNDLAAALGRAADLRIYTEFRHNEHIDVTSENPELVREVAEFAVTYLLDGSWSAGVMSLRQPIELPVGFGPRPSMSFFLYNQDGEQAIARPFLDVGCRKETSEHCSNKTPPGMPKYHLHDSWDDQTNAPSHNFVYDFDVFGYFVNDSWQEVLAHDARGRVVSGSLKDLTEAFAAGCALKIGVSGLCDGLAPAAELVMTHELFVQAGPGYHYTEQGLFMVGSHPIVRVRPAIPMRYESQELVKELACPAFRLCGPLALSVAMLRGGRWRFTGSYGRRPVD